MFRALPTRESLLKSVIANGWPGSSALADNIQVTGSGGNRIGLTVGINDRIARMMRYEHKERERRMGRQLEGVESSLLYVFLASDVRHF